MLIDSREFRTEKTTWLNECVLKSISHEAILLNKDGMVDVKLLINGIEHEPKLLQSIYDGIETIVDREALTLAQIKFDEALADIRDLYDIVKEAEHKIRDKFHIPREED